ncbi:hypothetical protein [Shimia sp. FJ5]|uniref:spike base protein, RCAP_Rcc01079 family n=1 Tax=Shimia sp. FJ5 TaxID=3079054 RepID=UPI00293DE862|nr:hypothetical protein [Shimia sp. FJ5]MDV4144323.1 hypothetical protein [Shimia sp. FJ5]
MNPFADRARSISGPATDALPVVPDDSNDLPIVAIALYAESGGTVVVDTVAGETRSIAVADFSILPLGVRRIRASGTSAAGLHALVLA